MKIFVIISLVFIRILLISDHISEATFRVEEGRVEVVNPHNSRRIKADIYCPAGKGPYPLVIIMHGFMHNPRGHRGNATYLSEHGFVVAVPSLRYRIMRPNPEERAQDMLAFLDGLLGLCRGTHPLLSRAEAARVGLVGHSAGGLTALMVASRRQVQALVCLDPVLTAGPPGSESYAFERSEAVRVRVPVLFLEAPPQRCNNERDRGMSIVPFLGSAVRVRYLVNGASHCDFIDQSVGCSLVCGRSDESRRHLARVYTTAWCVRYLVGDRAADSFLFGNEHRQNMDRNIITVLDVNR